MRALLAGVLAALLLAMLIAPRAERATGESPGAPARGAPSPARRVVSLNPSLTAILIALDAGHVLVGVDDFSAREHPALASLPRVGGLYNPSLESVAALRPELVVLVPSFEQRDFRARLAELAIPTLVLDPLRFDEVLDSILALGRHVGRERQAETRVAAIRRTRAAVERAARGRARPSVVLALQRDPLFVAGRNSFLDDMLAAVGAENLGARLAQPYPRASIEWLVAAAPSVILDVAPDADGAAGFWSRWPSIPAVANGRVITLAPGLVTLPGPYLDRALLALARALHGAESPDEARRAR